MELSACDTEAVARKPEILVSGPLEKKLPTLSYAAVWLIRQLLAVTSGAFVRVLRASERPVSPRNHPDPELSGR